MFSILIIDELPGASAQLASRLRQEGHVTTRVVGLDEADAFIADGPPDLILLNFSALGSGAVDAMDHLRRNPRASRIPVELFCENEAGSLIEQVKSLATCKPE